MDERIAVRPAEAAETAEAECASLAGSRFDFARNRAEGPAPAGRSSRRCYDAQSYRRQPLRLAEAGAGLAGPGFSDAAETFHRCIEDSLYAAQYESDGEAFPGAGRAADALLALAATFADPADRQRAHLHAEALCRGYRPETLAQLADPAGELTVVAGAFESWFGKSDRRLPTGFIAAADAALRGPVEAAGNLAEAMGAWLAALRAGLKLTPVPQFSPTRLVMMAGEGNRHPKHVAYFLPSDQGVSRSPFKRTYYFGNVHLALVDGAALPLSRAHLDLGVDLPDGQDPALAALGVFAHEVGHCVHRSETRYAPLNRRDRWNSVMLQEIAADVFGVLLFAEVIAPAMGFDRRSVVAYHLGECLRYVDRGLGSFADCDGMYLQLSYLAQFGVLAPVACAPHRLRADPDEVLAALRSLARVLADTLLADEVERALALCEDFGPAKANPLLGGFLRARAGQWPIGLDYLWAWQGR